MKKSKNFISNIYIMVILTIFIVNFTNCSSESHIVAKDENHTEHNSEVDTHEEKTVKEDGHEDHDNIKIQNKNVKKKQTEAEPDHDEEGHISLSDKAIELAGIKFDKVNFNKIHNVIELPGEIGFNEDRFCKVVPRFPGIVKKVNKKIGDIVKKGDILAIVESNESLATYNIKSLISGTVVKKNITIGEFVSNDTTVYEVANLSNIWVNLVVYAKNSKNISVGQRVNIESIGTNMKTEGIISYISSFYNRKTRNLIARVVIPNHNGQWYPGTFVKAKIFLKGLEKLPVIPINAVQKIDGEYRVFIPESKNEFKSVDVVLGKRDKNNVQIIKGLKAGDTYISKGAFELKAKLIINNLGSHAGHGH